MPCRPLFPIVCLLLVACVDDPTAPTDDPLDTDTTDTDVGFTPWWDASMDPFADAIVDYSPGPNAGFGQEDLPDIVLGAPIGGGEMGSLDVLTLGEGGSIVLAFDDYGLVDGPGPDMLVFENPFIGWTEAGRVSVSEDGETWETWPCEPLEEDMPGCAGVQRVWSTPDNGIDPTDPDTAGGDAFDLADLGIAAARFVRIEDTGTNSYAGDTGGFDLDAVAIVNGEPLN